MEGRLDIPLYDMHCHLDFAPNAAQAAERIQQLDAGMLAATVEPDGYEQAASQLAGWPNVRVAAGIHPWWIRDDEQAVSMAHRVCELAEATRFVGEVGLDFGKNHAATHNAQLLAFRTIMNACARLEGRIVTIHAVKSAHEVLDVLQQTGAHRTCACIFHWYSGPSDALKRAVELGCSFSMGAFGLQTKRGREYARIIPAERLLLETDFPAQGEPYDADAMQRQLRDTLEAIAALRNTDPGELAETIAATSKRLLGLA